MKLLIIYSIVLFILIGCGAASDNRDRVDIIRDTIVNKQYVKRYNTVIKKNNNIPRQFMPVIYKNILVYESGQQELNNNTLILKNLSNGSIKRLSFDNKNLRRSPFVLIKIDDRLILFFLEVNTAVYQYYDSKKISFDYNGSKNFVKFKSVEISESLELQNEKELFQIFYGASIEVKYNNGKIYIPYYIFSKNENKTSIGVKIYDKNFNLKEDIYPLFDSNLKFVEPSIIIKKDNIIFSLRALNSNGKINFGKFYKKDSTATIIESSLSSPSSMNKLILYNGNLVLFYNNVYLKTQGPRNSFDIAIISDDFDIIYTDRLLYSKKDYFSNFSIDKSSKDYINIVLQRLNKFLDNSEALDSIELLTIKGLECAE